MAKKITPQEACAFCSQFPCECKTGSRRRTLQDFKIEETDEEEHSG